MNAEMYHVRAVADHRGRENGAAIALAMAMVFWLWILCRWPVAVGGDKSSEAKPCVALP